MTQNRSTVFLFLLFFVFQSCMQPLESDLQQSMERDDRLLRDYISRNDIDATETQLGYYYKKETSNDLGNQIINQDILGVYYEIKTIDGQLVESYLDETKRPRLFRHDDGGLVPRAINFATGLAKEGETLLLYVPSYLAYQEYRYQQLILPNSNLVIKVKFAEVYSPEELKEYEDELIQEYIASQNLTGFEKNVEGLYLKTVAPGDAESPASVNDKIVRFGYSFSQLDGVEPIASTPVTNPFQIIVGNSGNLKFLNQALTGVKKDTQIEVIAPSNLAFGGTVQVFPFQIRKDLFDKGYIGQLARPYEPIIFKATIVDVK